MELNQLERLAGVLSLLPDSLPLVVALSLVAAFSGSCCYSIDGPYSMLRGCVAFAGHGGKG